MLMLLFLWTKPLPTFVCPQVAGRCARSNLSGRLPSGSDTSLMRSGPSVAQLVATVLVALALALTACASIGSNDLTMGKRSLLHGNYAGAVDDFTSAIAKDPKGGEAYALRGYAKFQSGNVDGALSDLDVAVNAGPDRNPEYSLTFVFRSVAKAAKGDLEGAIADCSEGIAFKPDVKELASLYHARANMHFRKGNYDAAIVDLRRTQAIVKEAWTLVAIQVELSYSELALGHSDRALAEANSAIVLKENFSRAYVVRALAYRQKGDADRALKDATKAMLLAGSNSGSTDDYEARGLGDLLSGDSVAAVSKWEKVRPTGYRGFWDLFDWTFIQFKIDMAGKVASE